MGYLEVAAENLKLRAELASLKADSQVVEATINRVTEENDRLRDLLREARSMWVDDHSNLANRIDAAIGDQPQDEDCTCVGFHTGACKEGS